MNGGIDPVDPHDQSPIHKSLEDAVAAYWPTAVAAVVINSV